MSSIRTGDPPVEAVAKIAAIVEAHKEAANLRDLQVPVSLCGRVVNAFIWEVENWELVHSAVRIGNFIRLRNVAHGQKSDPRKVPITLLCCKRHPMIYSYFLFTVLVPPGIDIHAHSWITPVPNMCYEIRTMLEEHDQRSRRNDSFNPSAALLPIVDGSHGEAVQQRPAPPTPPRDLGSFACSPALGKFTGTVHLRLACPELASDPGRMCKPKGDRTGVAYRFGVKIWQDPPCPSICVLMGDSAAEKLLGMSAAETLTSLSGGQCAPLLDPNILWNVTLRSVAYEGVKYIILSEITRQD
jgi:hypothetical protein